MLFTKFRGPKTSKALPFFHAFTRNESLMVN